ncbi:MAG: parvulin peptidyl-prolyl isomerase [Ignavibacteriales bacterium]|nr:MAG: parvulin peptidyl-prolyl isomerase [Ignavibacteriales bacterium]
MKFKLILLLPFLTAFIYSQEVIDKIVAVVDDEIIMKSELEFRVELLAAQNNLNAGTPGFKQNVLNSLIEEKLVLAQANLDSIIVSDEEVNSRINYQIDMFIQQYGSQEKVEQVYGMSVEKIKREMRDEVRKNLMIQRLREKNFANVESSRKEVEDFFRTYKDSLGIIPEKVKISHIYRNPKASDEVKKKSRELAEAILDSVKAGVDFAVLAKKYSEDPGSAAQGGDLGFVKRGIFYPEFESAAFSLEPNEISDVVESPAGFHIMQLLEKRGESVHTRHILIKIKTDDKADINTIDFLSEIRDSILMDKKTFAAFAKRYSEDKETAVFGGELGTFYMNQLDKTLLDAVSKLKEGEISFPRRIEYAPGNYGYHIVYLKERVPQHTASLETDYDEIKKISDEYKRQERYKEWIDDLKEKIYWEVRL